MPGGRTNVQAAEIPYSPLQMLDLTQIVREQLYYDFEAIMAMLRGIGSRWGTVVVAASDSTAANKKAADYRCTGTNDQIVLGTAISSILSRTRVGRVVLLEGTYTLGDILNITLTTGQQLTIEGQGGSSTVITGGPNSGPAVKFTGGSDTRATLYSLGIRTTTCEPLWFVNTNAIAARLDIRGTAAGSGIYFNGQNGSSAIIVDNNVTMSGSGVTSGIFLSPGTGSVISSNNVSVTSGDVGSSGIKSEGAAGFTSACVIDGNYVSGNAGNVVGILLSTNVTVGANMVVSGNYITNFLRGIVCNADYCLIEDNWVQTSQLDGINVSFSRTSSHNYVMGNYVRDSNIAGTTGDQIAIWAGSDNVIAYNKVTGSGRYGVAVIAGSTNCGVFFNDTYGGFATGAVGDSGTATRREGDFITTAQLFKTFVNSSLVGTRRGIDVIAGTGITVAGVDSSGDDEVDVTITNSRPVPNGGTTGQALTKNSNTDQDTHWSTLSSGVETVQVDGATIGSEATINLKSGAGVTLSGVDSGGVVSVTISESGAAAAGASANVFNYRNFH